MEKKMDEVIAKFSDYYDAIMERNKDTAYFICGEGSARNENGLPESIFICPALGSDITVKYTRVD